ncbi:family A1 protease [Chiua virens]|nr:family A1 protease [Chiua virens]
MKKSDRGKRIGKTFSIVDSGIYHVVDVGIGQPASNFALVFDTGSSNTWVGQNKKNPFKRTSTSVPTGKNVSIVYGTASFSGKEWTDKLSFSPELGVNNQSIGVAAETNATPSVVPTVMNNLHSQRHIWEAFGVYFGPNNRGGVTIGGIDHSVITGSVRWAPRTKMFPSSDYWGVDASWLYDGITISSTRAGVIDTGTTLNQLAPRPFERYRRATGATLDSVTGTLKLNSSQFASLKTLTLKVGNDSYDLCPEAQVWPPSRNAEIGGDPGSFYLTVANLGGFPASGSDSDPATDPDSGLDFMVGHAFLRHYYSVYDATHKRVGFAPTSYSCEGVN